MEYVFLKTFEISDELFLSYVEGFNIVYEKNNSLEFFKHTYMNTVKGYSYHVFLVDEGVVVGACTVIPYEYLYLDKSILLGLSVGLYIRENYRKDMLTLNKITDLFRVNLKAENITSIIAINNDNAYSYYKRICKWKDIGALSYYFFPINPNKFVRKNNRFYNFYSYLAFFYQESLKYLTLFFNFVEKGKPIRLNRSDFYDIYERQKYYEGYKSIKKSNYSFTYKVYMEDGIRLAYIIDFYNRFNTKDSVTLSRATTYIMNNEIVDGILYIGTLSFFTFSLFKVPTKYEPRRLHFTCDILDSETVDVDTFLNVENWDFGLFNFDVR